jgi:transcriptional regulator with XRE-family HTH domain
MHHEEEARYNRLLGGRLQKRRMSLGMSRRLCAQALGLSVQQLRKYEEGQSRIGVPILCHYSSLLGTVPHALAEDDTVEEALLGGPLAKPVALSVLAIAAPHSPLYGLIGLLGRRLPASIDLNVTHQLPGVQTTNARLFLTEHREEWDAKIVLEHLRRKNPKHGPIIPAIVLDTMGARSSLAYWHQQGASGYIPCHQEASRCLEQLSQVIHYWCNVMSLPEPAER